RPGCIDCAMPTNEVPTPTTGRTASRPTGRVRGCRPRQPSHSTKSISGHTQSGVWTTIWNNNVMETPMEQANTIGAPGPPGHRGYVEVLAFFAICRDHRFTMRESSYFRLIPQELPGVVGLAIVMGVTGPFGTYYGAGLAVRLVFFTSTAILIWLQVLLF